MESVVFFIKLLLYTWIKKYRFFQSFWNLRLDFHTYISLSLSHTHSTSLSLYLSHADTALYLTKPSREKMEYVIHILSVCYWYFWLNFCSFFFYTLKKLRLLNFFHICIPWYLNTASPTSTDNLKRFQISKTLKKKSVSRGSEK